MGDICLASRVDGITCADRDCDIEMGVVDMTDKIKKPDEALAALGELYRDRNKIYGDTYKQFGGVMKGFFPGPITVNSEEDWNRLALFFHCADKLARYASAFSRGTSHVDSLDDLSVYSMMLQEYDAYARLVKDSSKARSGQEKTSS